MGITFAYELGLKSFIYEKASTRKVTSEFKRGNPVKHFQNPQKPNRNNYFIFLNFGQIWSNYGQTTYSRNISVTK